MGWWRICGLTLLFVLLTAHFAHAYERDVHYDLTKYLAQWAGFSDSESEQIAAADQELDAKPEFNPLPNPNFCPEVRKIAGAASALAVIPEACKNDPEFQRMLTAQRAYHFVDGKRLQELRDSAFRGRNLKILGHYLHALQDTFSHSLMDYADLPPSDKLAASLGRLPDEKVIGHLLYGHSVDRTYERPDLAEQMARYVYTELTKFQGSENRWDGVEAAVVRFVNAKDGQRKLSYLSATPPSLPPATSSQPSGLPTKPQEPLYEGRSLVDWQSDLRDPSSGVREKAADALGHFGDKAVPFLAQTLGEPDPDVRWAAAYALGEIGPAAKDAVPALVQALTDPDDMVRGRAEVTLRRIDPSVLREAEPAQRQAQAQPELPCKEEFIDDFRKGGYAALFAFERLKPCPKEADEARKAAADQQREAFLRKYAVQNWVTDSFCRNPFAYDGKTVAAKTWLQEMTARDTGTLYTAAGCTIVVSEIPQGTFGAGWEWKQKAILAAKVLGRRGESPHLKFVGIHVCKQKDCEDFFGPESLR